MARPAEIVVVGGAGHVGLPLAIVLARTRSVAIYDTDRQRLESLRSGRYPYKEAGGQKTLAAVQDLLAITDDLAECPKCRIIILATYEVTPDLVEKLLSELPCPRLIVLRSTAGLGATRNLMRIASQVSNRQIDVAYCPERSVEGKSLEEMQSLPQLVGCDDARVFRQISQLLSFVPELVHLTPEEAEAAKLLSNAYRFAQFALANQFYVMLLQHGLDPQRVFNAAKQKYPRMSGFPRAGLVGGPCLRKDSLLLLGGDPAEDNLLAAAIRTNDGMARFLVNLVQEQLPLKGATAGLLGCAFKADSDDARLSPGRELAKLLTSKGCKVLFTDPYVVDSKLTSLDEVIQRSTVLFVVTPHTQYRDVRIPLTKAVIDP